MSDKVRPLFPDRAHNYAHPTDAQVRKMVGVGWSVQMGADYVTLQCPNPQSFPVPNVGWAMSIRQARQLAAALSHYADKLADQEWERAQRKDP